MDFKEPEVTNGNGVHVSHTPLKEDSTAGDCERVIIVGAGGFGREVLQWARHAWPNYAHKIAGFLSAEATKLDGCATSVPILGSPESIEPKSSDAFLLAIGIPRVRRSVAEQLKARGARFLTLIHPSAIIADTAKIGEGTIICPYAIVSDAARLGQFVLLNYHSSLGHDASVGDFAVLSPYATLGGGAEAGADVFLALHASLGPRVRLGPHVSVAANSCALKDSPSGKLVYGVPGRIAPQFGVEK